MVATLHIDGAAYSVKEGQNLLQACLSLGFNLPYFCWHPAMHSVGACRQCAVKQFKDEKDTRGKIIMSCMTPATEGMRISIEDPEARAFRAGVIEALMVNHPHDCPVCDEGGECHLQDMTVMTGHVCRRARVRKRTHRNQDMGPFVNHEMNRCIACYRCVRYYRELAGGRDLDVFGWHHHVYFGRQVDGPLESEFSGNLVEVCPTGVFTDKTLKGHYARKWDLQTAPSVCVHCSLGCNTIPGERYGELRRVRNRFNEEVNGYFLCDRGRYGYEYENSDLRLRHPLRLGAEGPRPIPSAEAVSYVAGLLRNGGRVLGIGSPRASLEGNFALRALVGAGRFFIGWPERERALVTTALRLLREGAIRTPCLREVREADAALALGEDVSNTAPMLAFALRQCAMQRKIKVAAAFGIAPWDSDAVRLVGQDEKSPIFIATPCGTRLDDIATRLWRAAPEEIARLGFAVAKALDPDAPEVPDLSDEAKSSARDIAAALREAERPVVVSGTGAGSPAVLEAAGAVAAALRRLGRNVQLSLVLPECNSAGAALLGGGSLAGALSEVRKGQVDTLIILENDLYRRLNAEAADALLAGVKHLMVLDHLANATTARAEVALPCATFAESEGTLVSQEGRAQRFFAVHPARGEVRESWRWLREIGMAAGQSEMAAWQTTDDLIQTLSQEPGLSGVKEAAPGREFRAAGQKIPRQPHRYSGRTAMGADVSVHEPPPPEDRDSPLAFSMEGYQGQPPAALVPRYWAPGWNSDHALNKFQGEVGGAVRGGPAGVRLIEPAADAPARYAAEIPPPFQPAEGQWLVVALHHVFGSEELSAHTPGVAQLAPRPYLGLSPEDAQRCGVGEGDPVELAVGSSVQQLPARIIPGLPRGLLGLPAGLAGVKVVELPAGGRVRSVTGGPP